MMGRWALAVVVALGGGRAAEEGLVMPEAFFDDRAIPIGVVDGDAGASLVRAGRYGEVLALVREAASPSLELRNNAALGYLLRGETLAADIAFKGLAAFCDARWDPARRWGGAADLGAAAVEVLAPCLAVYRNWAWSLAARPEFEVGGAPEVLQARVEGLYRARLRVAFDGSREDDFGDGSVALSVYDVGLEGDVCRHFSAIHPSGPFCGADRFGGAAPPGDDRGSKGVIRRRFRVLDALVPEKKKTRIHLFVER